MISRHSSKDPMTLPHSPFVTPLLTDLYQLSMAYAYWQSGKQEDVAVFDLVFRKNPFGGEFTVFAGLEECLRFVDSYKFEPSDIELLKSRPELSAWKEGFWAYLAQLDASLVKIHALREGSLVFPRIPLLRVEGPLILCQLLESTFLNLVNFASLISTNAARHRIAAGRDCTLLEFGLRRAQGPDGGMSASRYSVLGGFDATSNVLAACIFDLPVKGTQAHSFISSYTGLDEIKVRTLHSSDQSREVDFVELCQEKIKQLEQPQTNESELSSFIAYAQAYPNGFLALVDTYNTLNSGVWNFLAVALALHELGYTPRGIRLDSGDLAYLSKECRKFFRKVSRDFGVPFDNLTIVASSDLSEDVLYSLKDQGHEINTFGIGTHLVTCQLQPALGCVYKLVQINGEPRIKISDDFSKITIPGRKTAYRLYDKENVAVVDYLTLTDEPAPQIGEKILCTHPFNGHHRFFMVASRIEKLHCCVWNGAVVEKYPTLKQIKVFCQEQIDSVSNHHIRKLNPTPYKVFASAKLFELVENLWQAEVPVVEVR